MTDMSISEQVQAGEAGFSDYFALLKPRVMSLVVFTAFVGLLATPVSVHPMIAFASIVFIAVGAGAAGTLNMWCDADIDKRMRRTRRRPVPSGKVAAGEALGLGLALSGLSIVMLGLVANLLAAALLAFTIFFYIVIYSLWLKRVTPQNIVIGGAAGALPPIIGWAAASGSVSLEAWLMFALILVWTPPHFWALALFTKSDYGVAKIPMLTVTHGTKVTRRSIFQYTVVLLTIAVASLFTPLGGFVYLAVVLGFGPIFLADAYRILHRSEEAACDDHFAVEKRFFKLSLYYLFLHFGAILVDSFIGWNGLGALL